MLNNFRHREAFFINSKLFEGGLRLTKMYKWYDDDDDDGELYSCVDVFS